MRKEGNGNDGRRWPEREKNNLIVIELFANEPFAIFVIVLSGPLIVLFVSVAVPVAVTTAEGSTAKVRSLLDIVEVIPVPPRILNVSPLAESVTTVELSSAIFIVPSILVPSPIAVYISVKLLLIFSAPRRRLSPVPSFGVEPLLITFFAMVS